MRKPGLSAKNILTILLFLSLLPVSFAALLTNNIAHSDSSTTTFVTFESAIILSTANSQFNSSSSFDLVTFTKPVRLDKTFSSSNSSTSFEFVTFQQFNKLSSTNLLHSSKSTFDVSMNYTNRTNITLTITLPDQLFEGMKYDVLFILNNTGNQNLAEITFNFMNYTLLLNLSAKETATYSSSFIAHNSTLIAANLTARINSNNSIFRNASVIVYSVVPLTINEIRFEPEQSSEGDDLYATVLLSSLANLNATIYSDTKYYDFYILENQTREFIFNITAVNNTNFTTIIDAGSFLLIGSKKIHTGLLPDLTGQIFAEETGIKLLINTPISTTNFTVRVIEKNYNSIIHEKTYFINSIHRNTSVLLWNATAGNTLIAYIDFYNQIIELNESNNQAESYAGKNMFVVIDDSYPAETKQTLLNYIQTNIKGYSFSSNYWHSDTVLSIGETYAFDNTLTLKHGFGTYKSNIVYYDEFGSLPYNGIVNYFYMDGKKRIFVLGNSLSGTIAALKQLVKGNERVFIGDENLDAVRVYDYFTLFDSLSSEQVNNALYNQMITSKQINTTSTSGIPLRLLHLSPAYSDKLVNYLQTSSSTGKLPVVLSQGLWSNLYSWQNFGVELADSGRDVYLIEITGGPGQDCEDCVNYDFDDLTEDYYPALINKVKSDSGRDKIQYVGFSNGCRTALSSLQKGAVDAASVDTFVGVGCPGAFEGEKGLFAVCLNKYGNLMIEKFAKEKDEHLSQTELSTTMADYSKAGSSCWLLGSLMTGDGNISLNLAKNYLSSIESKIDTQPGCNASINNFYILYGTDGYQFDNDNDYIVTVLDEESIYNEVNTNNKYKKAFSYRHDELPDKLKVKNQIKEALR